MKKTVCALALLLSGFFAFSQTLERQVISPAGSFSTAGNVSLSATVGEVAITTLISGSVVLTQGFQQPNKEDFTGFADPQKINLDYTIYPNPATNTLNVELKSDQPATLRVEIHDITGKQILITREVNVSGSHIEKLDISSLSAGTYLLTLIYNNESVKSFQVIKSN